jgi:hypothetical protein
MTRSPRSFCAEPSLGVLAARPGAGQLSSFAMTIQRTTRRPSAATSKAKQPAKAQRAAVARPAARKPAAASSFQASGPKAKGAHESVRIAPRRADPAREFPDFLTGLGGFTQLQWKPLRENLLDFKAGRIAPTAGGRSDMVPVDARSIRSKLDAFLKQPEVERGLFRDGNIYEVEENFLRKWGLSSRDEVNDLAYRGEPAYLEVPRGQERSPLHAAAANVVARADADPKYAALLTRVLEDPLTALMLVRANSIGVTGPKPKPHEQQLAADLHALAYAADQMSIGGELAPVLQAEQGLRELKQLGPAKQPRIDAAMVGLSWKKPDFGAL